MDFGDLFKRGWQITWNNKYLYILGFLAALGGSGSGGGGGGGGNANIPGTSNPEDIEGIFGDLGFDPGALESMVAGIIGVIIAVICVLLVIRIVLWFVRMIAEAGMIKAVTQLDRGATSSFRQAWSDGRPYMFDIFIVNLLLLIIPIALVLIILAVVGFSVFSVSSGGNEALFGLIFIPIICLVCLLVPYSIVVNLIYPIAQRGIIFKGVKGMDAIRYGWNFLKEHTSDVLILAVLFFVVGLIVGIISLFVTLPILAATALPVIFALIDGSVPTTGSFVLVGIGLILMIIIGSVISAIYISFRSATFTLAYHEMDGNASPSEKDPSDLPVEPLDPQVG